MLVLMLLSLFKGKWSMVCSLVIFVKCCFDRECLLFLDVAYAKAPASVKFKGSKVVENDVYGSSLGIIGMGQIGFKIAKRAQGFDMNIFYHNRRQR